MSDSTDNTNELDSYGVWVKNTKQDEGTDEGMNFADSLDLPDFEETDNLDDNSFSDMFNEDDTINLDGSSDETTLTDDELMNITSGEGIEIAEAEAGTTDDSLNEVDFSTEIGDDFNVEENPLDDVSLDSLEENSVTDAELGGSDVTIEEPVTEETEDNSLDDFEFEDFGEMDPNAAPAAEPAAEETVAEEPAVEAAEEPVSEDVSEDFGLDNIESSEEEISLDDFMDSGFSDESVASGNNGFAADAAPAGDSEEVSLDDFVDMSEFGVSDEAPKKEEAIADEKPLDMDISFDSSADSLQTEDNLAAEDLPDDDYQEEEAAAPVAEEAGTEVTGDSGNDIEAEEVDLSDFGIDENAEETPVTQDVEGSKNKDTIVDYDLSVGDGNMNAAPVVNEIKASANEDEVETIEEIDALEETPAVSSADSTLLKQIVDDLSNLKEEINTLKNNLEEMKNAPVSAGSGVISEEIAVEDDFDSSNEDTGFFSGDDGDDTIALSTDELSNILNTADFSSEEEAGIEPEAAAEDSMGIIDDTEPGKQEDLTYDFTDENLSEPNLDDIEIDEGDLDDDLPDEISIPKEDDIFVESSSSDFMDSVQDTTEEHEQEQEAAEAAEAPAEEAFSTVDNLFEEEKPESVISEVSDFMAEPEAAEEPAEAPVEEPVVEETIIEEPAEEIADETFVSDAEVENDFVSHEDENNNLTDSNIDYLTTEEPEEGAEELDENAELKKDIKSVLLYMDQLLENLPEEKIVEFAKSDEFTTYKKLFSELGLS